MKSTSQADDGPEHVPKDFEAGANTVGEFYVHQRRYQIVALENHTSSDIHAAVSRFQLSGQHFAVIDSSMDAKRATDVDASELLTARELQIATLVAVGRPNKQIARQLRISEWTVATHLRRIFAKLGVRSRAAMVFRCAGIVDNDCGARTRRKEDRPSRIR